MKRNQIFTLIAWSLLIILLAGCGTAPPAVPTMTPGSSPGEPVDDSQGQPTLTALPPPAIETTPESYPDSQPALPQQPTRDANYPAPPTFPPTIDPYPGGMVWIIRPVGVQCEDGTVEGYGDLQETVATMVAAGMEVEESELIDLPVASVCGGPTSAHYRLQVSAEDLDTARSMGWNREQ